MVLFVARAVVLRFRSQVWWVAEKSRHQRPLL